MLIAIAEYRAEVLEVGNGKRYTAAFPTHVTRPVQYGINLKAHAVYMRIHDHFSDQMDIDLSVGTLCNFNAQASISTARASGCIRRPPRGGRIFVRTTTGAQKPWMPLVSYGDSKAFCATTTTSRTSPARVSTRCAMRIA